MTIKSFLRKIHLKVPAPIRAAYSPFLWKCAALYKSQVKTFFRMRLPVYVIHGKDRHAGYTMVIAYAGICPFSIEYFTRCVLAEGYQKNDLGRHWFWNIQKIVRQNDSQCSILFSELNHWTFKMTQKKKGFNLFRWVDTEIDIDRPLKEIWKKKKNDIPRRIRKHKLTCTSTKDPAYLDEFYYNMHVPHIQSRFGNSADVADYYAVKKIYSRGELFLIHKDGEVIAGSLAEYKNKVAKMRILGIKGGKHEYLRYGVIGAKYYYTIVELQKRGYKKIDTGGTSPILSDGLTMYKMSVEANLIHHYPKHRNRLRISLLKDTPGLRQFLINNPFVYFPHGPKPVRAVFLDSKDHLNEKAFERIFYVTNWNGLTATQLFVFGRNDPFAQYTSVLQKYNVTIRPAEECFDCPRV